MITRTIAGLLCAWCLAAALASGQEEGRRGDSQARVDARALWKELNAEERLQLVQNYERWKQLPPEKQEDMRRRHGRLQRLSGQVEEALPDEERKQVRALPQRERRREMQRRTKDLLKRTMNLLPEDARETVLRPDRGASRAERSARFMDQLGRQVMDRMQRMVARLEQRGSLEPEYLRGLKRRMGGLSAGDRFLIVRDLLLKDPEAFQVPQEMVQRLERARSPVAVLRLLPELRAWDLPSEGLRRYLREEQGMPDDELRGMQRWLHSQGVPAREVRRLFQGEESEWPMRLRAMRRRFDLPAPPRSFKAPEGRRGPGGRGPGPGRSR